MLQSDNSHLRTRESESDNATEGVIWKARVVCIMGCTFEGYDVAAPHMTRCNNAGCQVHPEGKYVVDIDAGIDINKCTPGVRVALRNDSYALHLLLPTKVRLPLAGCRELRSPPVSSLR